MKLSFLLVFALLSIVFGAEQSHEKTLLSNLYPHTQLLQSFHKEGRHSEAFSVIMLLKLRIDELRRQRGLPEILPKASSESCSALLNRFAVLSSTAENEWSRYFEHVESLANTIVSKCTSSDFKQVSSTGANDLDDKCALCVVILRVMDNYIKYHRQAITEDILKAWCMKLDGVLKPTCEAFVHYAGPTIIDVYYKQLPADIVCLKLKMCTNAKCRLVNDKFDNLTQLLPLVSEPRSLKVKDAAAPWQWIIDLFTKRWGDQHLPVFDLDNDTFSDVGVLRGYHWKGPDCNEYNPNIYPGRKIGDTFVDHDCNGIYGQHESGRSNEQVYCQNTNRLGVAVIGDSAGAHFSIPEKYFNVTMMEKGNYNDLLRRIGDELDLPQESGYTAHTNTDILSHSVYKYLRKWNLCNNNDYQNIGVNGGDSGNTWGNIKALKRDPKNDHPMLMFMELIGNDVCAKSFDGMTDIVQFKANILKLLRWLDTTVPKGSHLWIFGLADGELLYNNLYNHTHPLDLTYAQVYDFLNCLQISPCWGWLNTNATVRRFTTERAMNLSKMYSEIIKEYQFENFDIVYYDFPADEIIQRRILEGGAAQDLIERCDGFHPNGLFHSYLADWIWFKLQTEHPTWIGPQNPHNRQILDRFKIKPLSEVIQDMEK